MKIVYFSHYSGKGGANFELVLLVREMVSRGDEVIVVMPKGGWLYDTLSGVCRCVVVPYHRWVEEEGGGRSRTVSRAAKWFINRSAALRLYFMLKDENVDIVHTNDSITVVGAYTAKLLKVPHIWHMREIFDGMLGFRHTYSESYCGRWMGRAERIIAISDAVKRRYERYEGLNIVRIYDGVTVPALICEKNHSSRMELLFCGGTSVQKGFPDVLALAERLQEDGVDFHINIVASCHVDEQLEQELKRHALEERISFLGFVDQLEELRQQSDILLMCSGDEAFGLVTVEGMLSKTVVVGRRSGATVELIEDGVTGYLYDTVDGLVSIVETLKRRDNSTVIERAYRYAVENFSITSTADCVRKVYEEAAAHESDDAKNDEKQSS